MLTICFGSPGAGKTTLACRILRKAKKNGYNTFSNFGCKCADYDNIELSSLGEWTFPKHSVICIDESGIEYNNRNFKTFPKTAIRWYKLHRHYIGEYPSAVYLFSQSWEDTDITLRRLADRLYYMRKFGPFTLVRRVYKRVTIDEKTEQIIDGYKMTPNIYLIFKPLYYLSFLIGIGFLLRLLFPKFDEINLVWRRPYYKYFDTHEAPTVPLRYVDNYQPRHKRIGNVLKYITEKSNAACNRAYSLIAKR